MGTPLALPSRLALVRSGGMAGRVPGLAADGKTVEKKRKPY